ncbi:hypothetical protein BHM03_00021853 [Ensete ventricosum]|nr:hypothetical protein BHM03_00021853 [Ensete ventricosum]
MSPVPVPTIYRYTGMDRRCRIWSHCRCLRHLAAAVFVAVVVAWISISPLSYLVTLPLSSPPSLSLGLRRRHQAFSSPSFAAARRRHCCRRRYHCYSSRGQVSSSSILLTVYC